MFTLKDYQKKALGKLDDFFRAVRLVGRDAAWREHAPVTIRRGQELQAAYSDAALGDVPAVCVRIPTGGGKTVLASHAAARVGKTFRDTDAPVILWLVPSDPIRKQTLLALKSQHDPCGQALAEHYADRFRVCSLEDLATIGRHEVGTAAIVVVATIQSFNVKDKTIRNVYAFDEKLAHHFQGLTPQREARLDRVTEADVEAQPYLTRADIGRVKASLANWLILQQPIVVVDEAHNNRTDQAFRTLRDLHPACLIELTATPVAGVNVIYHVGAQELQRENMIKLPIVLMEHPNGWEDAVRDAILTRDRLQLLAAKEPDYIRPIVLFQAEPKNGEVTVEKLLEHLTGPDGPRIDRRQIAVVTGSQKELENVMLADPSSPVRYVITVEALKEGWDCPFAYVLCSLQNIHSAKDIEQLLGRVLRMPYARPKEQVELGKAYANVVSESTSRAADQLADRLVNNMGFEKYEADRAIDVSATPPLLEAGDHTAPPLPEESISLPTMPTQSVPESLRGQIEIRPTSAGATVFVRGGVITDEAADFLLHGYSGAQKQKIEEGIERARARLQARLSPSARGERFAPVPQLCLQLDGDLQPVENRMLAEMGEFDLFSEPVALAGFSVQEGGAVWEIDVEGGKVRLAVADVAQLHFDGVSPHATENDLVRWLDRECRQPDVSQVHLTKWLLALVRHLIADRADLSLTALVRAKVQLAHAVLLEIDRRRQTAIKAGFQRCLPGFVAAPKLEDSFQHAFTFPAVYAGRPPFYVGRYRFQKHFYPEIHDLREKRQNGQYAEEFLCARAIDLNRDVQFWVRNVEREPRYSFWLPTSTDYFYPDFICMLHDGRILAVEYKGERDRTNDDTREKSQIGHQWEKTSDGRCLFLLAVEKDHQGRDVAQQISDKIAGLL